MIWIVFQTSARGLVFMDSGAVYLPFAVSSSSRTMREKSSLPAKVILNLWTGVGGANVLIVLVELRLLNARTSMGTTEQLVCSPQSPP